MPLTITHVGGPNDGLIQTFNDTIDSIAIGRDSEHCDVVLDADARMAGRDVASVPTQRRKAKQRSEAYT